MRSFEDILKQVQKNETVYKIQKPGEDAFKDVKGDKATCTVCGAENVPVENHVCTTKIAENIDQYSEDDASKMFDYHERTGMLPENVSADDYKALMAKYNIVRDNNEDTDPAGGSGLHSHESMATTIEQFKLKLIK